jgi:hypothetical protein
MASFTRNWDEANPTDNTYAHEIDEYNRFLRVDCSDRLKAMIYGFTAGENDGNPGFKILTFRQQSSAASTPNADEIVLYSIDDGTNCGLYGKNEDGYAKQILKKSGTSLILNCEAGDYAANSVDEDDIQLANNAYMTALDAAGTGTVNLIKAGTNDLPTLPDSSEMASNAAPTEDEGIANKKYVDDNIGSANYTPTAYAGQESVTFPNGLIIKMGVESVAAYATDDVTYAAAFSNAVVAAFATYKTTENSYTATANAIPKTGSETSILQVVNGVNATVNIAWLAIGY